MMFAALLMLALCAVGTVAPKPTTVSPTPAPTYSASQCESLCGTLYNNALSTCGAGIYCTQPDCQSAYIAYFDTCNRNGSSAAYGSSPCFWWWQQHTTGCEAKRKRTDCATTCGPLYNDAVAACGVGGYNCGTQPCDSKYLTYFNTCNNYGQATCYSWYINGHTTGCEA